MLGMLLSRVRLLDNSVISISWTVLLPFMTAPPRPRMRALTCLCTFRFRQRRAEVLVLDRLRPVSSEVCFRPTAFRSV